MQTKTIINELDKSQELLTVAKQIKKQIANTIDRAQIDLEATKQAKDFKTFCAYHEALKHLKIVKDLMETVILV